MIVTAIEQAGKNKYRIYLEEEFAFVLYKGELSRFHIQEGREISKETLEMICSDVILKRAKKKAMYLLGLSDKTEQELRRKLEGDEYPDWAVDQALAYVKAFGYVNDNRVLENFIIGRKEKESQKSIYAKLSQKGFESEKIQAAMEILYDEDTEKKTIERLLKKKRYSPESADQKEKQKMAAYLARKGFSYRAVSKAMDWNPDD